MDRNSWVMLLPVVVSASPPARVAWIETLLRKTLYMDKDLSPPARVAWIETAYQQTAPSDQLGRHPRGWRG